MTEATQTTLKPIDLETARRLLRQAVESKGRDFVYRLPNVPGTGCHYAPLNVLRTQPVPAGMFPIPAPREGDPRDTSGCIVGTVLDLYGHTFHHSRLVGGAVTDLPMYYRDGRLFASFAVREYLQMAQSVQDVAGGTWGAALDAAEAWYMEHHNSEV